MDSYQKENSLLKHLDFLILDILVLQLSFFIGNVWYKVIGNMSDCIRIDDLYRVRSMLLLLYVPAAMLIEKPYKNILKRGFLQEFIAMAQHTLLLLIIDIVAMYFSHYAGNMSRLTTVATWLIYFVLGLTSRSIRKSIVSRRILKDEVGIRKAVLISSEKEISKVLPGLMSNPFDQLSFIGIFLSDRAEKDFHWKKIYKREEPGRIFYKKKYHGVPLLGDLSAVSEYVAHHWVDEVYLFFPEQNELYEEVEDKLDKMGVKSCRILFSGFLRSKGDGGQISVQKAGDCFVAIRFSRVIPLYEFFLKRLFDIIGGVIGCIFTGLVFLIIGPFIYIKSPGPIFFSQKRIGKNGKIFKMYKFRSMYLDAEERKVELMAANKISDGMMFKLEDDPRIIGSEKKGKDGKPRGIGNFIRNTSLDEFPQFFNVLKGDMSLVGTRPPTLDEWQKYSEHHRKRLSMRPGITGLWQVSGRSEITDFEEVVRLDSTYIDTWTVIKDISIILRTILVVFKRKGSS